MSRTTPFGFWSYSEKFLDASYAVSKPPLTEVDKLRAKPSLPAYFLVGHAIELALKSFLLAKGTELEVLRSRKYGHDLEALLFECRRRKLGSQVTLSKNECNAILLLNISYKSKKLEYMEYGSYRFPEYGYIYTVAKKLVKGLAIYSSNSPYVRKKKESKK